MMKLPTLKTAVLFIPLLIMTSCVNKHVESGTDPVVAHIDSSFKPGDDFFMYANNSWFKQHPIPESEQSNGIWQLVQDTINAQIKQVCEGAAATKNIEAGSLKQKIGDFYFSGMDSLKLNAQGLKDLMADLKNMDEMKTKGDIARQLAYIHTVSSSPMFGFYVGQDDKNSSKNMVFALQGGLSLPDRNYYFDTDTRAIEIRKKFREHLVKVFEILGYSKEKASVASGEVANLETDLAKISRKREDLRDPFTNYHKMSFSQFTQLSPNIAWNDFVSTMGLPSIDTVIVGQPEYFSALNKLLQNKPLSIWKDYLKYQFVRGLHSYLDDQTYACFFDFYATTLSGVKEPKPRWERVVEETNVSLGELIGQVYVAEYLPKGTKAKLEEIGKAIKEVFAIRIKSLDWMSQPTKDKALQKLDAVVMKVGYPDHWKDMSQLTIDRSSFVKNIKNANKWETAYMISKYGKAVDRQEWGMTPQTYNAYYNPSNNEIVIPGCNIIVPGFEKKLADDAILYSVIGATFGHEITHGFDDQGCKYNADGNLQNWWRTEDSVKFFTKTRMIVTQFNHYVAVDSLHINGELTQGENIADLGGIVMALEAFKKTKQFMSKEKVAGLDPLQRFFLGYALAWMVHERPEAIANQVKSN